MPERIISGKLQDDDLALDTTLRPRRIGEFIGQEKIKDNLAIAIAAAQQRQEPLDHIMLYGPPGLGKTTLGHIIAHEMSVSIRVTSGPAIERAGDLAAILTNLQESDILFIDEVHRLPRAGGGGPRAAPPPRPPPPSDPSPGPPRAPSQRVAAPAARGGWPTGSCGGCATTRR